MFLKCVCGTVLDDVGAPNNVEHLLLSYRAMEKIQDLVDDEVAAVGKVDSWVDHWDDAGSLKVWRCYNCARLYINAMGPPEDIVIYAIERKGMPTG